MKPDRRFRTFNDYLRDRFGDRVQRVTLTGGLVCPHPDGRENCPFCVEAARLDPAYGQGYPVHEQIRRGVNFARRQGNDSPLIFVTVMNPAGICPPADHLMATFATAAAQPGVVAMALVSAPGCVNIETGRVMNEFASPERDLWIEFTGVPAGWPVPRNGSLHFSVEVPFHELEANNRFLPAVDHAVALLTDLEPDAVGFVPPLIIDGTPEAELFERGELDEPDLETYADRVARVLERIPASIAVHPVSLSVPADFVVGPRWALNRQKVQEAIGKALEKDGSAQGDRLAGE